MIGLDTNVMIRYIVQDDPIQSAQASQMIEKTISQGEVLWISQITLCEIVWVLERCYDITKTNLTQVIKQLLQTKQIRIEHDDVVWLALGDFEDHLATDFSDCLIGRQNASRECSFTYTFDKNAAKKLPSLFRAMPPLMSQKYHDR